MSREQIEEMDKDIGESIMHNSVIDIINGGFIGVNSEGMARELYDAGYSKQSEGEWIKDEKSKFEHRYYCSVCNFYLIGAPTKHCEDCGAKMKGGAEE